MNKLVVTAATAVFVVGLLSGAMPGRADEVKVGFIEFAPISGSSWVRADADGVEYLRKEIPNVHATIVESVPIGPAARTVMKNLIAQGNKIIFAQGYGYGAFAKALAEENPDVYFVVQQDNPEGPKNLTTYYGKLEEARYLQGVLAGKMTKTNKVGFVGAFPVSPVICGVNAFGLGLKSVNPSASVIVNWANTWYDPQKEKEAADALLNIGVDIVVNHEDSAATLQAAAARGKWAMTSNADWSSAAPNAFLTGSGWNWGPYYVKLVKGIVEGKFDTQRYLGDLADGVVILEPYGPAVTAEAKQAVADAKQQIISGKITLFAGPMSDNQGKERIAAGKTIGSNEACFGMDWLAKGIEGSTK